MEWQQEEKTLCLKKNTHPNMDNIDSSQLPGHSKQQLTLFPKTIEGNFTAPPWSQWCEQVSYNHVKLLGETFPFRASIKGTQDGNSFSHGSLSFETVGSDIQHEVLYDKSSKESCFKSCDEAEAVNRVTRSEYRMYGQTSDSWAQEADGSVGNVLLPHAMTTAVAPNMLSKRPKSIARERATMNDRRRRIRIAEALDALQKLLPISKESDRAALLDDIIDHIKLLQFHIKELSRSKLGGETASDPLIFLEGYGHYLPRENMLNEPLEEVMGKLFEVNPSAATLLLETRGLLVMPITLAEGLQAV